jgi:hypothetical protein
METAWMIVQWILGGGAALFCLTHKTKGRR